MSFDRSSASRHLCNMTTRPGYFLAALLPLITLSQASCTIGSEGCSYDEWKSGNCVPTYDTDGPAEPTTDVPSDPCRMVDFGDVAIVASGGATFHNYEAREAVQFLGTGDGHGWAVQDYPAVSAWLSPANAGSTGWPIGAWHFAWTTPRPEVEIGPGQTLVVWHWVLWLPLRPLTADSREVGGMADLAVGALVMTTFGPGEEPENDITWIGELSDVRPLGTPVASEWAMSNAGPGLLPSGWWPVRRGAWAWQPTSGWCLVEAVATDDGGDL